MARNETTKAARPVTFNQEVSTGVITQNGPSTDSSVTFSAHGDKQLGHVQCWVVKTKATADVAYDAAGALATADGAKPARGTSYRIIKVETVVRSLRTGGTPDHDLKVEKGDGAASESFSSLVATVDIDSDTVDLPTERILVAAQSLLASGETLRVQASVAGSTTTGTAEVDFHIYVIPVAA